MKAAASARSPPITTEFCIQANVIKPCKYSIYFFSYFVEANSVSHFQLLCQVLTQIYGASFTLKKERLLASMLPGQ